MTDDVTLVEFLCARLCHDLSGPVGAAAAGAELLNDEGGADSQTLGLVADSAAAAAMRLRYFRAAFGPAGRAQPATDLRDLIAAYLGSLMSSGAAGLELQWQACDIVAAEWARLVLNLVLVARDALPRGGLIVVSVEPGITVSARGQILQPAAEAVAVLMDGGIADGPRGAQALFARRLAERAGLGLSMAITSTEVTLTAR